MFTRGYSDQLLTLELHKGYFALYSSINENKNFPYSDVRYPWNKQSVESLISLLTIPFSMYPSCFSVLFSNQFIILSHKLWSDI